jgi:hypothetical protein
MPVRRAAALAAFALVVLAAPAAADHTPWIVSEVAVALTVGADARLHVRESITFERQQFVPFAFRSIPLHAADGGIVRVRDVEARDANGQALALKVTERDDVLEIRTLTPLTMAQNDTFPFHLSYTVYRALRHTASSDMLDWPVAPSEWHRAIPKLHAQVRFPPSVPPATGARVQLTGPHGAAVPAKIRHGHQMASVDATAPVKRGDSARLTVLWPAGHVNFATPETPVRSPWPLRLKFGVAWVVPGAVLLFTTLVWTGGHYAGRRPVVPVYGPPPNLRPGEAGVVIDGRVDAEDIVAAVVDLAVRGVVMLERAPGQTDVVVTIRRPWITDPDVRPWEIALLTSVFSWPGLATIRLSALRAPRDSASIRDALSNDLTERGLFAAPPVTRRRTGRWVAVIATAIWMQLAWNEGAGLSTVFAGFATGLALWLLAGAVAAGGLTAEGRRARQQLRGFREFLMRVDTHRLDRLRAGTLDEHLPWAIALGVTEGWLAARPVR